MTEERKNEIISLLGYLAMLDIASDEMAQRGIKYSEVMEFLDELAFPDDTFKMRVSELAKKYNISHQRDIDWHNFVAEVEELTRPELAEWSEEDEEKLERVDDLLWILDSYIGDDCSISEEITQRLREEIENVLCPFLKSLRPQPHWNPSEEQMEALADTLEDMPEHYKPKCTLESLERDLEKL